MATRGSAVKCDLDFSVAIDIEDKNCQLEWNDQVTKGTPGEPVTQIVQFRRGTGALATSTWNVYLYDRTDGLPNGNARPAGTKTAPLANGLPSINRNNLPALGGLTHRPFLTSSEYSDYVAGTLTSKLGAKIYATSQTDTWWLAEFDFDVPSKSEVDDNLRVHDDVTFLGAVEMI